MVEDFVKPLAVGFLTKEATHTNQSIRAALEYDVENAVLIERTETTNIILHMTR